MFWLPPLPATPTRSSPGTCDTSRHRGDYDRAGVVSASDVTELLDEAAVFRQQVRGWLSETHPRLMTDQ